MLDAHTIFTRSLVIDVHMDGSVERPMHGPSTLTDAEMKLVGRPCLNARQAAAMAFGKRMRGKDGQPERAVDGVYDPFVDGGEEAGGDDDDEAEIDGIAEVLDEMREEAEVEGMAQMMNEMREHAGDESDRSVPVPAPQQPASHGAEQACTGGAGGGRRTEQPGVEPSQAPGETVVRVRHRHGFLKVV